VARKGDGVNDEVKSSTFSIGPRYAISMIYRNDSAPSTANITKATAVGTDGVDEGVSFNWNHTNGAVNQAWEHFDTGFNTLQYTTSLLADTWYVLTVTYDGTTARGYLDGTEEPTAAVSSPDFGATPISISWEGLDDAGQWDDGEIAELAIWNFGSGARKYDCLRSCP